MALILGLILVRSDAELANFVRCAMNGIEVVDDELSILLNINDGLNNFRPQSLMEVVEHFSLLMPLLNRIPSLVFFVKDREAKYVLANQTLATRCGFESVKDLLGQTSTDVFGASLGEGYTEQDFVVLKEGSKIIDKLELHSYRTGEPGWCHTHKLPIYDVNKEIVGMLGVSLDIHTEEANQPETNEKIHNAVRYIRQNYDQTLSMESLASLADLSVSQFDRTFKKLFHMTPTQYIQKVRFETAIKLLKQNLSITEISVLCGYSDHSAFSRQFKQLTGLSPSSFKETMG
ncbi:Methylphosphotriester-DNA--protein-cysteine S-methyltransferase [Oligella ureolytica]|nr:Methylphosphotriester-DNA--protein-cysteine S-methyltransferase [Oligella ureolytica]